MSKFEKWYDELKDLKAWKVANFEEAYGNCCWFDFGKDNSLYVSYAKMSYCSIPMLVLEDLKQNVFFNDNVFKVEFSTSAG